MEGEMETPGLDSPGLDTSGSEVPETTPASAPVGPDDPRARLAGALGDQMHRLMPCVHCGFCLPVCPTYRRLGDENDSPRGRLYLMRAVVEGRLEPASDAFQEHIDRCLGCRACEPVCPSGVEYGLLLEKAREVAIDARPPTGLPKRMLAVFRSTKKTLRAMSLARRVRDWGIAAIAEGLMPRSSPMRFGLSMLNSTKPAPLDRIPGGARPTPPASDQDPEAVRGEGPVEEGAPSGPPMALRADGMPLRVALLTGCVQEGLLERVNRATERVLRANGFEVVTVARQGCCGAIHAHAGAADDAGALALDNVRAFSAQELDAIVVNAAGCGATMKEYVHLLEDVDPAHRDTVRQMQDRVRDLSEVLALAGPRSGAPLDVKVTYDSPCHLEHAQGIRDEAIRMLQAIPRLELVPLPGSEECCGGAGIYGITHPELGGRIGGDKATAILGTGAEVVATPNPGCMMQIGGELRARRSGVRVVHPVELLDESYRRAGFYG